MRIALLGLLAACGSSRPAATIDNQAVPRTATARIACPAGADLEQLARSAWKAPGGDATAVCTAFVGDGSALWLVDGRVERGDPGARTVDFHTAVIAASSGEVLSLETDPSHPATPNGVTFEAVDLDGDGADELIGLQTIRSDTYLNQEMWIAHAGACRGACNNPGVLDQSGMVPIADGAPEASGGGCYATHRVIDGPDGTHLIELVGTNTGNTRTYACPKIGRHLYRWDGEQLVEAAP